MIFIFLQLDCRSYQSFMSKNKLALVSFDRFHNRRWRQARWASNWGGGGQKMNWTEMGEGKEERGFEGTERVTQFKFERARKR